jgi:hypothetical protein
MGDNPSMSKGGLKVPLFCKAGPRFDSRLGFNGVMHQYTETPKMYTKNLQKI